jgi:hypothetical protein
LEVYKSGIALRSGTVACEERAFSLVASPFACSPVIVNFSLVAPIQKPFDFLKFEIGLKIVKAHHHHEKQ